VRELLQAREAVLVGVERRLDPAQRERGQREHLATPADGLLLEAVERHDRVDQPMSRACWASYWRVSSQNSMARLRPIWRASRPAPKPPSHEPTRGPVWPNRALSAAIVRSQQTCRTCPPPTA
jgi:hypothetical protein